ncbi:MAG: hypothetical protein WAW75_08355 [Gallionella sp.]
MRKSGELTYSQQRRSLWPTLTVSAFFGAIGVGIALLPHSEQTQTIHSHALPSDAITDTATVFPKMSGPPALALLNPYRGKHEGFQGFVIIRPVPELVIPLPLPQNKKAHELALSIDEDPLLSATFEENTTVGNGLELSSDIYDIESELNANDIRQQISERKSAVIHWDQPDYPVVAKADFEEGNVVAVVQFNTGGWLSTLPDSFHVKYGDQIQQLKVEGSGPSRIIEYFILSEQPTSRGFAESLIKTFPSAQFVPAISKGQAVSELRLVTMKYCLLGPNCNELLIASAK